MRGLASIGLGFFLYKIYDILKYKSVLHTKTYTLLEVLVFIYGISNIYIKSLHQGRVVSCIFFMILILMFSLKKGGLSNLLEKPFFAKLSQYCLAIYLMQGTAVYHIFPYYLHKYPDFITEHKNFTVVLTLSVAVLFGVFAHHVIEKPATNALKNG